jgi:hypothetical protein
MQTRAYPRFAARVLPSAHESADSFAKRKRLLIDRCVNAHAYGEPRTRFHMENFLALLRLWRKNQTHPSNRNPQPLGDYLKHLADSYTRPSSEQERVRLYYSRRWLRKLERTR